MASSVVSSDTSPLPSIANPSAIIRPTVGQSLHSTESTSSSTSSSENDNDEKKRGRIVRLSLPRPKATTRKSSGTNIIPRDHSPVETRDEPYPPGDARAMSPRRNSTETEKLGEDTRTAIHEHARTLQSGLSALVERIENVKMDHDKLEKQNLALQDYIGGLTRSMSRTDLTSSRAKK
ncbi:hypothetical protein MMC12_001385 [Toensbergia leucococca]|nr:hypothetical protein [Toensbergia leucococca]